MVDLEEVKYALDNGYFVPNPLIRDMVAELERLRNLRDGYQGEGKIPYV